LHEHCEVVADRPAFRDAPGRQPVGKGRVPDIGARGNLESAELAAERPALTDSLTRLFGTGETQRTTGHGLELNALVSETQLPAGDQQDVRRFAHNQRRRLLTGWLQAKVPVHLAAVADSKDRHEPGLIVDRINNPVIAGSNPQPWPVAAQRLHT
jgi:hypothetical protein